MGWDFMNDVMFAFLLTLAAGLFTGIGGLIALFSKRNNTQFLAICLSFAAGVMIYISFVEIFAKALESLEYGHGDIGYFITTAAFFAGIALIALIDKVIPQHEDEVAVSLTPRTKHTALTQQDENSLNRMGLMSALSIAIHNFPEGLVTFMAALYDPALGAAIAIAIAIHNIPEGIAIAAPIFYATGRKKKAILAAIGSGITEPLGGLAAYFLLARALNETAFETAFGLSFAAVGGIMVYIAIHQLLPTAAKYGRHNQVMWGLFGGMAVMALSLIAFG